MDNRKWQSAAAGSPPSVPGSPSSGFPTNGNPGTSTPATIPGDWWFHQIGEELRSVIVAAGLTPTHSAVNQLLAAIKLGQGPAFHVHRNGVSQTIPANTSTVIQFGTELFDTDNAWDTTNFRFTCPTGGDGIYSFGLTVQNDVVSSAIINPTIRKNGAGVKQTAVNGGAGITSVAVSALLSLVAGDLVDFTILIAAAGVNLRGNDAVTYAYGSRVRWL